MRTNIITAEASATQTVATSSVYQYDYGLRLEVTGLTLPDVTEWQFSNSQSGAAAYTTLGDSTGCDVPNDMLMSGEHVYAWLFLHTGTNDGYTVYTFDIPVIQRTRPTEEEPTAEQEGLITQAIAALNNAVTLTAQSVTDAAGSASDAADSARAAAQSEDNAEGFALRAEAAEGYAEAAQAEAQRQAGLAADSATEAQRQAGLAAGSVTDAQAQVSLASGYATEAQRQAGLAAGSATAAENAVSGAITSIQSEGTRQVGLVTAEGTTQTGLVTTAGTTQTGLVTAEGTEQVGLVQAKGTEVLNSIPSDYSALTSDVTELKSDLTAKISTIEDQFPEINGTIFAPNYEFGTRYVSSGADTYASNTVRMSFKRGDYISLKQGDLVTITSTVIQYFGGGYSTNNGSSFTSISAQSSAYTAPVDGIYFFWLSKPSDAAFTDTDIANASTYLTFTREGSLLDLKEKEYAVTMSAEQLPEINGVIVPPPFAIGTRYVTNGADTWLTSTIRLSFKKGAYISLKEGDVVSKASSVYAFGGGYTTDNGLTFTAISNRTADYTAPADGLYFFCLSKSNDAEYTTDEIETGWKLISFTRPSNMKATLDSLSDLSDTVDYIQTAIGYDVVPVTPTEYYTMPNANKGLNYLGVLVDDTGQDSSDYIALDNLYDICRVVPNTTKYGLGSIVYYNASYGFIRRDQPGTDYSFSIYNGETVAWLSIDKTVANAKYVRFCGENSRNYKYWVVYNGGQATALDDYDKLPFLGKKIVNFGDSIFGLTRPPKDVSSYLATKTGATVYNAGFGGCEMSNHADSTYNPFSMCNLADAIATNTWTDQETAAAQSGIASYFAETVTMLEGIDFSDIDIVTIGYGTNDWNNGTALDGGTNTDKTYFADALRYSIETLLTAYPNLKIFICTQTYRFFMDSSYVFTDDCTTHTNSHGKTLTDFVDKTIEVANAYNVPHIDLYHIGMNKFSRSQYFYSYDGTHPMPIGNQLIADKIAHEIF